MRRDTQGTGHSKDTRMHEEGHRRGWSRRGFREDARDSKGSIAGFGQEAWDNQRLIGKFCDEHWLVIVYS